MKKPKMQLARENTEKFKENFFNGSFDKRELTHYLVNKLKLNRKTARRYSAELIKEWIVDDSSHDRSKLIEKRIKKHSKSDDARELVDLFIEDHLSGNISRSELIEMISEDIDVAKSTIGKILTEKKQEWLKEHPNHTVKRAFPKRGKQSTKGRGRVVKLAVARGIAEKYMPKYFEGKLSRRSIIKMFKECCPCVEVTAQSYFDRLKSEYKNKQKLKPNSVEEFIGLCCQHCGKPPFPRTVRFQLLPLNN